MQYNPGFLFGMKAAQDVMYKIGFSIQKGLSVWPRDLIIHNSHPSHLLYGNLQITLFTLGAIRPQGKNLESERDEVSGFFLHIFKIDVKKVKGEGSAVWEIWREGGTSHGICFLIPDTKMEGGTDGKKKIAEV